MGFTGIYREYSGNIQGIAWCFNHQRWWYTGDLNGIRRIDIIQLMEMYPP